MIEIKLTFLSPEDAISALAMLRSGGARLAVDPSMLVPGAKAEAAAPKPDGAKPEKATKPEKAAASAPTASAAPAAASATQPSASSAQVDYAGVAERITKGVATHRAEVVALLKKFDAKNGKELKPEQYADFAAQMDELLKPEEALA